MGRVADVRHYHPNTSISFTCSIVRGHNSYTFHVECADSCMPCAVNTGCTERAGDRVASGAATRGFTWRSDADSCGRTVGDTKSARSSPLEDAAPSSHSGGCPLRSCVEEGPPSAASGCAAAAAAPAPAARHVAPPTNTAALAASKHRRLQATVTSLAGWGPDGLQAALDLSWTLSGPLSAQI